MVQRLLFFLLPQGSPYLCLLKGCLLRKDEFRRWVDWLILELERSETCDSCLNHEGISGIFGFHRSLAVVTCAVSLLFVLLHLPFPRDCSLADLPTCLHPFLRPFSILSPLTANQWCLNHTVFTSALACSLI